MPSVTQFASYSLRSFDDLFLRDSVAQNEKESHLSSILTFRGFPESAIAFSSCIEDLLGGDLNCLTDAERSALEDYYADSSVINTSLGAGSMDGDIRAQEELINKALDKLPAYNATMYRGVRTEDEHYKPLLEALDRGGLRCGSVLQNKSFLSFTSNPYALNPFICNSTDGFVENNSVIFTIHNSENIKCIYNSEFEGVSKTNNAFEVKSIGKLNIPGPEKPVMVYLIELKDSKFREPSHDFYGRTVERESKLTHRAATLFMDQKRGELLRGSTLSIDR